MKTRRYFASILPFAIASLTLVSACGDSDSSSGTTFAAPKLGTIVDAALPSSLKTSSSAVINGGVSLMASSTCSAASSVSSGCGTAANYIEFLKSEVFNKVTTGNVAATLYYRYWVDVLDAAMAETNTRLSTNSSVPACINQTAVAVDFTFNVNGSSVTVSPKLQCWEQQTGQGTSTQNMAFGKDDTHFYLVYRTNDNATTSGSGIRIVIGKAAIDGSTADIWFLGTSYQSPIGGGATERRGNIQRVLANKNTGSFTFNTVEEDDTAKGYLFGSFYGNTDGNKVYFEAAYGNGTSVTDVTGMTRSSPYCATQAALTTPLSASECSSINTSNMPSGFGLTAPMTNSSTGSATLWQADSTAETAFETAVDTIIAKDYDAAGVGKFTASSSGLSK